MIYQILEPKPLAKLKDSLYELIVKLERSVCVPEFCINSDIHNSCQYLTKKLIEHLQEITFCYDLSDMPRATNKGVPKKEKSRANSVYLSIAPSESELIESAMRKKSIKCKRKQARNQFTVKADTEKANTVTKTLTRTGRFTVSTVNYSWKILIQLLEKRERVRGKNLSLKKKKEVKKKKRSQKRIRKKSLTKN